MGWFIGQGPRQREMGMLEVKDLGKRNLLERPQSLYIFLSQRGPPTKEALRNQGV